MSTQDSGRIPFTIAAEQQALKLMELPQSILDLVSSSDSPSLHIKSLEASATKPSYVALCTKDQTFQLRQVQTSNSVYITRAAPFRSTESVISQSSVSAIATCSHTLELHPSKDSPLAVLEDLLPEFRDVEDLTLANGAGRSMAETFVNVPSSDHECEKAWEELCAFVVQGRSWRPSATAVYEAWSVLLTAAMAESIPLTSSFPVSKLHETLMDEKAPIQLFEAMILRVSAAGDTSKHIALDRATTVEWLGKITLQVQTENTPEVPLTQFITAWREVLPDDWKSDAKVDAIKSFCRQPTPRSIAIKSTIAARTVNSKSGKWHEKFKTRR